MKTAILVPLTLALGTLGVVSMQAQDAHGSRSENNIASMSRSHAGDYAGMWQGMLRTEAGSRRVALDVSRALGDNMVANVVTSAQSPYSVLVDTFEVREHRIVLGMKTAGTGFEGSSNASMTEIRGTWKQDGKSIPLTLKRVDTNMRADRGEASGVQNQVAGSGVLPPMPSGSDESPSDPVRRHKQPAFSIGPPHWFWWYDWTPQIGNQDRPYGTYYW